MKFEIEDKNIKSMASVLGTLHRASFPNAVRSTINSLAFITKKEKLLRTSKFFFQNRTNGRFIKANSGFKKATGFDVKKMASFAGMLSGKGKAVDNLQKQEHGGIIKNRSFIARDEARTGGNFGKKIKKSNQLNALDFVNNKNATQTNKKQGRAVSIQLAADQGKNVLLKNTLFRVKQIRRKPKGKRRPGAKPQIRFKLFPLYSFKKGRSVSVSKKPFVQKASLLAVKSNAEFFTKEFLFEVNKVKRKNKL